MKAQHNLFAIAIAKGKDQTAAYLEAYPQQTNTKAATVSACKLMKRPDIKEAIANYKKDIISNARDIAIKEVTEENKFLFLSIGLKRHILHKIASGKMKTKVYEPKTKTYVYSYPSDDDKIKAIKLDAELCGEGWRPPDPGNAGPVQNNTYIIRKTVFNTRQTTAPVQQVTEIQSGE